MTITAIVPVHNGAGDLRHCLAALQRAAPDAIIVVDDGSTDNSAAIARELGAQVIELPTAAGPARARNLGAAKAQSEVLFFVDADVCIHPDALAKIRAVLSESPDLAAVFGSYDADPAHPGFLSQYRNLLHHYYHQTANAEATTFWAGCGAIRRSIFEELGGFDERWRHKIEDIELGCRLRRAGRRVRLCTTLQGQHRKRWTAGGLLWTDIFVRGIPWTELIWREGELVSDLNLRPASRASVALAWLLPVMVVAGVIWPPAWVGAVLLAGTLCALNAPVYRFFRQQRGWWFMLAVIPWHWLYYFYGGLAFLLGTARHFYRRARA